MLFRSPAVSVSQRELDSRVDDRIRQFMSNSRKSLSDRYDTGYDDNMHALRSELNMSRSAELKQLRRELDTVRSQLATSSMPSDSARLSALRRESEEAAKTSAQMLRKKAPSSMRGRRSSFDF